MIVFFDIQHNVIYLSCQFCCFLWWALIFASYGPYATSTICQRRNHTDVVCGSKMRGGGINLYMGAHYHYWSQECLDSLWVGTYLVGVSQVERLSWCREERVLQREVIATEVRGGRRDFIHSLAGVVIAIGNRVFPYSYAC